ncbi:GntR family transcriptional regulator [Alcaligenaceae bacterium]|nr:GntR family transcriptional regulator [Alcaligenaceae bacterium]
MKPKNPDQQPSQSCRVPAVSVGRSAKSLPDIVAGHLMEAIQSGTLPQGERLKEEMLAENFEVSRSTIREAIALLERKGVVERIPRQGARVITIEADEIEEIFLIRAQLLGLAARLFAENAPTESLEGFEHQAHKLEQLASNPETAPLDYANASIDAQHILMSFGSRDRLRTIYEALSNAALWRSVVRERAISFTTDSRRKESARDWRRVAAAILARDGMAAEEHAKLVLLHSYESVKANLTKPPADAVGS